VRVVRGIRSVGVIIRLVRNLLRTGCYTYTHTHTRTVTHNCGIHICIPPIPPNGAKIPPPIPPNGAKIPPNNANIHHSSDLPTQLHSIAVYKYVLRVHIDIHMYAYA